ncbi:zinc protease [Tahibacter aquaticus]|uniref:Zinc protease n=1 Tax=Tahibacter aquaticus TaxID=520092 RepID=A0A4R6Z9U8_9GAMM|nr:pitrilysin family protein [Tahibacter aquaticus]TDR48645.1 zinc protease [Tahibacter aquaticus]
MIPKCKPDARPAAGGFRCWLAAVFVGLCVLQPVTGAPVLANAGAAPPAYVQRTLANGLRVLAIRDTTTPNVSVQVWYRVGGKDDPKGGLGFAHLFEHLMFKQTRNLPAGSFVGLAEDVGGTNDASTEDDYTRYYTTVPAAYLERILFAEAERMSGLVIEPADFAAEREVVKNEIRMRVFGEAYGKLVQMYLPEVSYSRLPYARPTLGSIADLDAATVDEARAFHAIYYRPDNAVLMVAGNYEPAQLDALVDHYFAPIAQPVWPVPRVDVVEPERTAPTRHVVYETGTPSPAVVASYAVPPEAHADTPALMVLDAVLSAGAGSRLQQALVEGKRIAQKSASLLEQRQLGGALAVYAILSGEVATADGEAALQAEVARLRDAPVTPQELHRAKNQILTRVVRARETLDGKAAEIAKAVVVLNDPAAPAQRLAAIAAVTAQDVQRVAATYLVDRRVAIIHYQPAEAAAAGAPADIIDVPPSVVQKTLLAPAGVRVVKPADAEQRIALPPAGKPAGFALTPMQWRLRNGLRVVLVERHGAPLASLKMVAPAGSAEDPPGRAGLAALTASLMTKGTATRSGADIANEIESLGGSIGTGAGWDGASISVTVRSDVVAAGFGVLGDVARNPRFAVADIDGAREQAIEVLDDQRQDAMALARLVAARVAFGNTPYGSPKSGTVAALKAIVRNDIVQTYTRAWRPATATLVIVGDVAPAAARRLAEQAFGDWRVAEAVPRAEPGRAALPAARVVVVDMPDAAEAAVVVMHPAAARSDRAYHALLVANATLGGGGSSRLNSEIRYKRALSYDAGSAVLDGRSPGAVVAATLTANDAAAQVVELMTAQMRNLADALVPTTELATRRQLLVGNFGRAIETADGLANLLGNLALQSVPLTEATRFARAVDRVDARAVRAAAARWLDPSGASIVVVGDARRFVDGLRASYPNLDVIAASELVLDNERLR